MNLNSTSRSPPPQTEPASSVVPEPAPDAVSVPNIFFA